MEQLSKVMSKVGDVWCSLAHDDASWPVQGHYYCKTCWREHPVPWAVAPVAVAARRAEMPPTERTLGRLAPVGTRA